MIRVNIKEVAQMRGIRTAYQLQKLMNIQPSQASKWFNNNFVMIGIDSLDALCIALKCTPNELLVFSSGNTESDNIPRVSNTKPDTVAYEPAKPVARVSASSSDDDMLSTTEVGERLNLSRKRVNDYINSGELKAVKGKGNHYRISEVDLIDFIDRRNRAAAGSANDELGEIEIVRPVLYQD